MKKWQKIVLLILSSIAFISSVSLYFLGSSDYSDPEKVEVMLRANCENSNHCIIPIRAGCAVCVKLFQNAYKLRKKLLHTNNLQKTKVLLKYDWLKAQKAGKSWKSFIADYQAHHIIPLNLLDESDALKFYYNNGGKLDFNDIDNGIMIKKAYLGGAHANHPRYNRVIKEKLNEILFIIKQEDITLKSQIQLFEKELTHFTNELRIKLTTKSIKGTTKVNLIFE